MESSLPVGPCLSTAQSQDNVKQSPHSTIYLSIIPSPAPPSRVPVSQVSSGTFIPTHPVFQLLTCLQTAQITEPHGISDPFVKDRHTFHQAFTDICAAPQSSQKAFFHSFATVFRQPLGGTSLVYLKFSTKDIRHSGVSSRHPAPFERDY